MHVQTKVKPVDTASWVIAAVAIAMLMIYIVDAALQFTVGDRFLTITELERGRIFGITSIVLFFAAFGVGLKGKSRITAALLVAGGFIISKSIIIALALYGEQLEAFAQTLMATAVIGYVILGLGIWQMVSKKKYRV